MTTANSDQLNTLCFHLTIVIPRIHIYITHTDEYIDENIFISTINLHPGTSNISYQIFYYSNAEYLTATVIKG